MVEFKVVCGKCNSDPEIITNVDGTQQAVCANCGNTDSAEEALRVASQHFTERKIPALQKALGRVASGHNVVKFAPKRGTRRTFKWHGSVI